ncbi:protease inhibitor I42 family protein [Algoriphagus sediminis]|uniref:Protease inhibitor I42 family protein n=1 Tax=Algoriphagus sediminis TaxID=3057113 RepID=A0ABT7Y843_9BACT|nr:protease inhibitor I42 family protein [Algoriphagus sediminis]MDN3202683.1 protease inhibitor I42 family protein [Algoriphagus sediminis]
MKYAKVLEVFSTEIRVSVALFIFLLVSCGPQNPRRETIETKSGEQFYIELPSKPTSGKKWFWVNKPDVSLVDSVGFLQEVSQTRTGDEAGIEMWNFEAMGTGSETVILEFKKSMEASPKQKRIYTINIR